MRRLKKNIPLTLALTLILISIGIASPHVLGSITAQAVQTRVVIIGDSIVAGQGDTDEFKGLTGRLNKGGSLNVETFGLPGATTKGLSMYIQHQIARNSHLSKKISDADVIILAAGLNDFWSEAGPKRTANNLRKLVKILRCATQKQGFTPKKFSVATLAPTTLPAQFTWSGTVNAQINQFPEEEVFVGPRLHEMPKALLGEDGIHPSPAGYAWIAERTNSLVSKLPTITSSATPDCANTQLSAHDESSFSNEKSSVKRRRIKRPTP